MSAELNPAYKGLRYMKRWLKLSHRATESLQLLRNIDAVLHAGSAGVATAASPVLPPAPRDLPPATPGEIYRGYSAEDLWIFDLFTHATPSAAPGFVTDFLGTRTRTSSLWNTARHLDNQVMGRPVPHDLFEAVEWVGVLKAVASMRDRRFTMMELGAGLGPWLTAGATAARLLGARTVRLTGVEADPGRFGLMRQQFVDNGRDPDSHHLLCGAIGVEAGRARWPRIADPANAAGARPVREHDARMDDADAIYMQGAVDDDFIEVEIVPFDHLLDREPLWDLVHVDVQGWEDSLCAGSIARLTERVRWLILGTHSRLIDGRCIDILHRGGWIMEHEKPTRFRFDSARQSLEVMTEVDGIQVWRNPRLAGPVTPETCVRAAHG